MPGGLETAVWKFEIGERETCFEKCSAEGYAYAGLQYKQECWCGNSYGRYGKADKPDECDCSRGSRNFGNYHHYYHHYYHDHDYHDHHNHYHHNDHNYDH